MEQNYQNVLKEIPEMFLGPVQINRVAVMAIDFLTQVNTQENIEAIQFILSRQEKQLNKLYEILEEKLKVCEFVSDLMKVWPERFLGAIHINRAVVMALNFLEQSNSGESIEALQFELNNQEQLLNELYKEIGEVAFA